jgi:hypothetical protein
LYVLQHQIATKTGRGTAPTGSTLSLNGFGMKTRPSADYAWTAILGGAVVYEVMAEDLLSEGTDRYRAAHPVLVRVVIVALAGHLGGMLPHQLDVFSANNLLHRLIVAGHRKAHGKPTYGGRSLHDPLLGRRLPWKVAV